MNPEIELVPQLNPGNAAINNGLCRAMAALHHLNDHGCTVMAVEVRGHKPVLVIDGPQGPFLVGALKSRMTFGGRTRCVMATIVHGCQVEWQETYPATVREVANGQ